MQKQTSLYIPKPCHEDWNKMTPTLRGKFCASCSKQVVDFSLMSDNQILNVLSNQSGKLCGRFDAEQLQRPLVETKIRKKKSWWMALTMPLLFLFERSEAQKNVVKQKHKTVQFIEKKYTIVGAVATIIKDEKTINGSVVDEDDKPLAFASVYEKGTMHGTTTDSLGNFTFNINPNNDTVTLVASYVGFETVEKRINLNEPEILINMQLKPITLGDVVVVGKAFTGRLGGAVAICSRITTFEKIDTAFKKVIGISTIYPNPAIKGNIVHLEIKNAGEYQMQLIDNQARLIQTEEINAESEKSTMSITIPSNIASGIYYLRLIDEQKKKSYTEKLIVQ